MYDFIMLNLNSRQRFQFLDINISYFLSRNFSTVLLYKFPQNIAAYRFLASVQICIRIEQKFLSVCFLLRGGGAEVLLVSSREKFRNLVALLYCLGLYYCTIYSQESNFVFIYDRKLLLLNFKTFYFTIFKMITSNVFRRDRKILIKSSYLDICIIMFQNKIIMLIPLKL